MSSMVEHLPVQISKMADQIEALQIENARLHSQLGSAEGKDIKALWLEKPWSCECCGTVYDEELIVTLGDREIYHGFLDGHFGNGTDLHSPKVVLKAVLEALGFSVENEDAYEDED